MWNTIFSGVAAFATVVAAVAAIGIGIRQNQINERSLAISNFVEVFLMPQQEQVVDTEGKVRSINWKLLVKNVSAYPIYLNAFTINGVKHDIGNTALPNNSESWYGIPIDSNVQGQQKFSIEILFEDYQGKRYSTEGFGVFNGQNWDVKSKKRVELP